MGEDFWDSRMNTLEFDGFWWIAAYVSKWENNKNATTRLHFLNFG